MCRRGRRQSCHRHLRVSRAVLIWPTTSLYFSPWDSPPQETSMAMGAQLCHPTGLFQLSSAPSPCPTPQGPSRPGSRQKGLTLQQAVGQSGGQTQPLLCPSISPHALLLSPVYEVQATMHCESGCGIGKGAGGGSARFGAGTQAAWKAAGGVVVGRASLRRAVSTKSGRLCSCSA